MLGLEQVLALKAWLSDAAQGAFPSNQHAGSTHVAEWPLEPLGILRPEGFPSTSARALFCWHLQRAACAKDAAWLCRITVCTPLKAHPTHPAPRPHSFHLPVQPVKVCPPPPWPGSESVARLFVGFAQLMCKHSVIPDANAQPV